MIIKRPASLFGILAGLLLLAFSTLSASLLAFDYRNARLTIELETEHTFRQNRALLQLVFDAYLNDLSLQLSSFAHQDLDVAKGGTLNLRQLLQQMTGQADTGGFDFILLNSVDGKDCVGFSPLQPLPDDSCRGIVKQFDDELYPWHLFVLDRTGNEPEVGMLTREPLTDRNSGYIHGYLYGAVLMSSNLVLVDRARSVGHESIVAVGLAWQDKLLVTTAARNSEQYQALTGVLNKTTAVRDDSERFLGQASDVFLDHEGAGQLQFATISDASALTRLERELIHSSLIALAVSTVLAAALALISLKITLLPFRRLLQFARQQQTPEQMPLHYGWIREINQLSQRIADILTDLARQKNLSDRTSDSLAQANARLRETNERNKALLHRIMGLQEEERKHLAQELHDDLGQTLTVVRTDAYLICSLVSEDSPAWASARSICQNAEEMYDIVYNRIINLRPLSLNDLGLPDAIRSMPALKSFAASDIAVETEVVGWTESVDEAIEISLYRIAQEALTNVLKHSGASRSRVRLERDGQRVWLEISDNGGGFDLLDRRIWERFGLSGMQERAEAIGGALEISCEDGQTVILVEVLLGAIEATTEIAQDDIGETSDR